MKPTFWSVSQVTKTSPYKQTLAVLLLPESVPLSLSLILRYPGRWEPCFFSPWRLLRREGTLLLLCGLFMALMRMPSSLLVAQSSLPPECWLWAPSLPQTQTDVSVWSGWNKFLVIPGWLAAAKPGMRVRDCVNVKMWLLASALLPTLVIAQEPRSGNFQHP